MKSRALQEVSKEAVEIYALRFPAGRSKPAPSIKGLPTLFHLFRVLAQAPPEIARKRALVPLCRLLGPCRLRYPFPSLPERYRSPPDYFRRSATTVSEGCA